MEVLTEYRQHQHQHQCIAMELLLWIWEFDVMHNIWFLGGSPSSSAKLTWATEVLSRTLEALPRPSKILVRAPQRTLGSAEEKERGESGNRREQKPVCCLVYMKKKKTIQNRFFVYVSFRKYLCRIFCTFLALSAWTSSIVRAWVEQKGFKFKFLFLPLDSDPRSSSRCESGCEPFLVAFWGTPVSLKTPPLSLLIDLKFLHFYFLFNLMLLPPLSAYSLSPPLPRLWHMW